MSGKHSFNKTFSSHTKILFVGLIISMLHACVHEPIVVENDLGSTDDGPTSDTVDFKINTKACEDGVVYFENEVLPIFIANCAISGCHDQASAEEDVILTNYQNIMKGIKGSDLNDSEYYKVLVKNEKEDLMPRTPNTEEGFQLPQDEINTIKTWIQQGALNNYCDECDTLDYTFNGVISTIISRNCATSSGCHGSVSQNTIFTSYSGIKSVADNGLLEQKAIIYKTMPPSAALPDCEMLLLKKWLDDGSLNN